MGIRRQRLLIAAMFVDTFGGGLLVPFELVYALEVADLSLPTAGLILSAGAAASIAVGPVAGAAVDRLGPVRVVVVANLLGLAGCASLLFWTNAWGYGLAAFLLSAYLRVFWAVYTPLVASMAAADELELWFGRLRGARYIGLSTGQALSGLAFVVGETDGLRLLVAANGLSFAAVVLLVLLAAGGADVPAAREEQEPGGGYRAALADHVNVALAGLNVAATVLLTAPILALPVFVLERLEMSTWVPGLLTGLVTATAAAGLIFVTGLVRGRRRLRNMQLAMCLWAIAFLFFLVAPIDTSLAYVVLFAGALLVGVGEAIYAPTADALPAALAPPHLRGRYAALHQMAWGVSEMITPALVAVALASGAYTLWLILAALAIAAVAAYRALERLAGDRDGVAGPKSGRWSRRWHSGEPATFNSNCAGLFQG
jgi:MFS family permease